ncbi:MAG: hypothetical protein IPP30_02735 [Flavobacterium sp.]|nr:hypothetical protein [Flavobacterium sp.]
MINLTLNINSPLEIPAVNSGDILDFIAKQPQLKKETPLDNKLNSVKTSSTPTTPTTKPVSKAMLLHLKT